MHSLHARHSPSCIKLGQWGGTCVDYVEKSKSYKRIEKLHSFFMKMFKTFSGHEIILAYCFSSTTYGDEGS